MQLSARPFAVDGGTKVEGYPLRAKSPEAADHLGVVRDLLRTQQDVLAVALDPGVKAFHPLRQPTRGDLGVEELDEVTGDRP